MASEQMGKRGGEERVSRDPGGAERARGEARGLACPSLGGTYEGSRQLCSPLSSAAGDGGKL